MKSRRYVLGGYATWWAVLVALYYGLPGLRAETWGLIGLSGVIGIVAGVVINRPSRKLPWLLLAAALTSFTAGQVSFLVAQLVGVPLPFPSFADVLYLLTYPLYTAGLLIFIWWRTPDRDRRSLIDALTLIAGLALLSWIYLILPDVHSPGLSWLQKSGAIAYPTARYNMVRCGIAVYGMDPFGTDPAARGLEPALELSSYVAEVKPLRVGESAGYGRRFIAASDTYVGVLPIGYGDGWRRGLSNNADVLVDGHRHGLIGTVSMDNVTIDLGADPTLGGMVATNTGGSRLVRYGDVQRNLLGLEVVLADADATVGEAPEQDNEMGDGDVS